MTSLADREHQQRNAMQRQLRAGLSKQAKKRDPAILLQAVDAAFDHGLPTISSTADHKIIGKFVLLDKPAPTDSNSTVPQFHP